MFEKRLNKALKQNLKNSEEIVKYCRNEMEKNYSERKLTEMQSICEYLIYKLDNNVSFEEYQRIQFNKMFGKEAK